MLFRISIDQHERQAQAKMLERRRVLRGIAGIAVTLPHFASLLPRNAWAQPAAAPKRALFWWFPDGVKEADQKSDYDDVLLTSSGGANWFPSGTETDFTPANLAAPLAEVKSDLIMFRGLDHVNWPTIGCPHDAGPRFSLTSWGDTSIDQAIAKRMMTRFRSVELGIGTWELERGDTRISFLDRKALPPQQDPGTAFRRLFASAAAPAGATQAAMDAVTRRRASVLDGALQEIKSVGGALGSADRQRLEFYGQSVRDLERSLGDLSKDMGAAVAACSEPKLALTGLNGQVIGGEKTGGFTPLFQHIAEAQMNIAVLALQCDLTRVVSLMFEKGRSDQRYAEFLPLKSIYRGGGAHHLAHGWFETAAQRESWDMIHTWRTQRFADMMKKLKAVKDADGNTLLYNSVLVKTSEIATGAHSYTDIPIVLAGNAGGRIKTGRYLDFTKSTRQRTAALWFGVAQAMGINMARFPEDGPATFGATAALPGLLQG